MENVKEPLKLGLQFFAEDATEKADTTPASDEGKEKQEETVTVPKGRFMQLIEDVFSGKKDDKADGKDKNSKESEKSSELTAKPESDFEKRLAAEKAKWQAEQAEKVRLENLPAEEKAKAEAETYKQQLVEKERILAERGLKDEALAYLSKEGYPTILADCLSYASKETKEDTLKKVTVAFETAITEAVKQRLKGKSPAGLGGAGDSENAIADTIAKGIRGGLR